MYAVARHLHIGYEEWNRIPWWAQRAYIEGMIEDDLLSEGGQLADWEMDPTTASLESFQELGLKVIKGG